MTRCSVAALKEAEASQDRDSHHGLRLIQVICRAGFASHLHLALLDVVLPDRELQHGGGAAPLVLHLVLALPDHGVLERSHSLPPFHILLQNLTNLNIILKMWTSNELF